MGQTKRDSLTLYKSTRTELSQRGPEKGEHCPLMKPDLKGELVGASCGQAMHIGQAQQGSQQKQGLVFGVRCIVSQVAGKGRECRAMTSQTKQLYVVNKNQAALKDNSGFILSYTMYSCSGYRHSVKVRVGPWLLCMYSLAFAQGVFHTVAPELLVVVNEGEGKVNIQGVGSVRGCCPLPRLKRNHQVHPGGRPLDLKLVNEILAKDLTQ